jgi:hypothetical protein
LTEIIRNKVFDSFLRFLPESFFLSSLFGERSRIERLEFFLFLISFVVACKASFSSLRSVSLKHSASEDFCARLSLDTVNVSSSLYQLLILKKFITKLSMRRNRSWPRSVSDYQFKDSSSRLGSMRCAHVPSCRFETFAQSSENKSVREAHRDILWATKRLGEEISFLVQKKQNSRVTRRKVPKAATSVRCRRQIGRKKLCC